MNTKTSIALPNLADDPDYAAAQVRLGEIQAQHKLVCERYDATLNDLNTMAASPSPRVDAVEAAAYKLLGGDLAGASLGGKGSSLREELARLGNEKQVLEAATRIQKQLVETVRTKASRRAIASVRPTHRELVRNIVECAVALDHAAAAEREFREALIDRGIALGELWSMAFYGFGRPKDVHSRTSLYLLEACEHDFISVEELPEGLRELGKSKKRKPEPVKAAPAAVKSDGWVG